MSDENDRPPCLSPVLAHLFRLLAPRIVKVLGKFWNGIAWNPTESFSEGFHHFDHAHVRSKERFANVLQRRRNGNSVFILTKVKNDVIGLLRYRV